MLTTTFNLLREHGACAEGYEKLARHLGGVTHYGKDTPIPLTIILTSNGLDDTLWTLRAVPDEQESERDRLARIYACDCAEHVAHLWEAKYPEDTRPRETIAVARRIAAGQATEDELAAAGSAAWSAAWSAGSAAESAGSAARAAAGSAAERSWQTEHLREMLNA